MKNSIHQVRYYPASSRDCNERSMLFKSRSTYPMGFENTALLSISLKSLFQILIQVWSQIQNSTLKPRMDFREPGQAVHTYHVLINAYIQGELEHKVGTLPWFLRNYSKNQTNWKIGVSSTWGGSILIWKMFDPGPPLRPSGSSWKPINRKMHRMIYC